MICLFVKAVSSIATRRPIIVTMRAAIFMVVGIVMTGVFKGRRFEVRTRPAKMLPQASRLIGLMTKGLFSLIGERGRNRGDRMVTKKITRKL